jgi:hypothetical protein
LFHASLWSGASVLCVCRSAQNAIVVATISFFMGSSSLIALVGLKQNWEDAVPLACAEIPAAEAR